MWEGAGGMKGFCGGYIVLYIPHMLEVAMGILFWGNGIMAVD